jgi:hypothetical protein
MLAHSIREEENASTRYVTSPQIADYGQSMHKLKHYIERSRVYGGYMSDGTPRPHI